MVYRDLVKEYKTTAKQWYLAISTGKGFVGQYLNICYNDSDTKFVLQDMNGDNRADLVVREGGSVKMYLAKAGFINTTAETQSCAVTGSSYLIPGGLHNGTGMSQLFSIYNHELSPIKFTVDQNEEELLTGVVNSFGVINKHTYTSTKDANASDYDKGTKCGYPFMNLTQKIFLYTGTNKYIANTLKESASYSYKRGVVELQGRGFTGFEEIKAYDNMRNTQVIYTFNPLSYGQLIKVDSPKETINLNYTVNVPANRISKVTLSSKSEYNKLRGTTISYTYTYDTYDNVTQEIINYGSDIKQRRIILIPIQLQIQITGWER